MNTPDANKDPMRYYVELLFTTAFAAEFAAGKMSFEEPAGDGQLIVLKVSDAADMAQVGEIWGDAPNFLNNSHYAYQDSNDSSMYRQAKDEPFWMDALRKVANVAFAPSPITIKVTKVTDVLFVFANSSDIADLNTVKEFLKEGKKKEKEEGKADQQDEREESLKWALQNRFTLAQ